MKKQELINQIKEIYGALNTQIEIIKEINYELYKQGVEWQEGRDAIWWRVDGSDALRVYQVATSNWRQKAARKPELIEIITLGQNALSQSGDVESLGWKLLGY